MPTDAIAPDDRLTPLRDAAGTDGWFRDVGDVHSALFRPGDGTLLVEFDSERSVLARDGALPWSTGLARKRGWATLSVLSKGRTWFRDDAVFDLFDELTDDGFFDDYDTVLFVGAGINGYAAAAFSLAAPGATVFLIAPLATLSRDHTPWEPRFRTDRALPFTSRYGYAPSMIDGARRVFVISDPTETYDAMHASLFQGDHVTHLRARHGGPRLHRRLEDMGILDRLVAGAVSGALTPLRWAQLWRARRQDDIWLNNLMRKLDLMERPWLQAICAGQILTRTGSDAARRRMNDALSQLADAGREAPAGLDPQAPAAPERMRLAGE
ncbi:hypothetical protein JANAI62_27450 [Jannaschia pagri]|uniref:Phosphoadenosine phosphosulfate reductase n=1 Tax=Jannaschia pagri TaxID=2829797 RepID=A0ABQ4NNY8_9RHOB|nr:MULTISPECIES: phosphoadenosine phosphosulfate reductase [unclassified Jannaschia]GIT92288.1 hypothetical protein JANAI61_27460 [Jannaschia sp. AI_61]GIT96122.1 hypothetical protein JANAI62_27450 [Jannaschia sp. AI_62]